MSTPQTLALNFLFFKANFSLIHWLHFKYSDFPIANFLSH